MKVERDHRRVSLTCVKSRDMAPFEPIALKITPVGDSFTLTLPEGPEAAAKRASGIEARVLDHVVLNAPATKRSIRAAVKGRASAIDGALEALEDRGLVRSSSKGWEACPDAPDTLGHAHPQAHGGGVSHDRALSRRESLSGHAPSLDLETGAGHAPDTADLLGDPTFWQQLEAEMAEGVPS